jgi:hypothetical protein
LSSPAVLDSAAKSGQLGSVFKLAAEMEQFKITSTNASTMVSSTVQIGIQEGGKVQADLAAASRARIDELFPPTASTSAAPRSAVSSPPFAAGFPATSPSPASTTVAMNHASDRFAVGLAPFAARFPGTSAHAPSVFSAPFVAGFPPSPAPMSMSNATAPPWAPSAAVNSTGPTLAKPAKLWPALTLKCDRCDTPVDNCECKARAVAATISSCFPSFDEKEAPKSSATPSVGSTLAPVEKEHSVSFSQDVSFDTKPSFKRTGTPRNSTEAADAPEFTEATESVEATLNLTLPTYVFQRSRATGPTHFTFDDFAVDDESSAPTAIEGGKRGLELEILQEDAKPAPVVRKSKRVCIRTTPPRGAQS